jgi:hypothetical protein
MFSLEGKTAIVTGAGRGLGAQIAKGLAQMGAFVFCVGRNAEPLLELCASIAETDGASEPLIFDVANEGDAVIAVNHVIEAKGRLDKCSISRLTVNCVAAIWSPCVSTSAAAVRGRTAKRLAEIECGGSDQIPNRTVTNRLSQTHQGVRMRMMTARSTMGVPQKIFRYGRRLRGDHVRRGSGGAPRNRLQRAEFVSEDPSISAFGSGRAGTHPMCQDVWPGRASQVGMLSGRT